MHAVYKQLHPPTAVNCCVQSTFTSPTDINLIISKANVVELYTLKQRREGTDDDFKSHLVLTRVFELYGNVMSLCPVRLAGNQVDALMISFEEEAKVLSNISNKNIFSINFFYVRCAALIIYDNKLVLLPFKQEKSVLESNEESFLMDEVDQPTNIHSDKKAELPINRQVIIDLKKLGLHTWCGRLAQKRNTCGVTAISFEMSKILQASASGATLQPSQTQTTWNINKLPHECYMLLALKEKVGGGALILGTNSIIHVNTKATYGLSLNDFAVDDPESACQALDKSNYILFLDTAAALFLSKNRILISMHNGDMYVMHIFNQANSVRQILLVKTKTSVPASCMCNLTNNYLFMGSRLGDSLLVYYNEKRLQSEEPDTKRRRITSDAYQSKKQSSSSASVDQDDDFLFALESNGGAAGAAGAAGAGVGNQNDLMLEDNNVEFDERFDKSNEDEEDAAANIYSNHRHLDSSSAPYKMVTYEFAVRDTIKNIGPISSMIVGDSSALDAFSNSKKSSNSNLEIIACSGQGLNGHISILQRNLRPEINSSTSLPFQVEQMWTLKKFNAGADGDDTYLVLALNNATKILQSGSGLNEITDKTQFESNRTTLFACNMIGTKYALQIIRNKAILLSDVDQKVSQLRFNSDVRLCSVCDPYVVITFSDGTCTLVCASEQGELTQPSTPRINYEHGKVTAASLYKNTAINKSLFSIGNQQQQQQQQQHATFCVVTFTSGAMEIYTVPDFDQVFTCLQFTQFYSTIHDEHPSQEEALDFAQNHGTVVKYPFVSEILLKSIGQSRAGAFNNEDPHLLVLMSDQSIHVYRAFSYQQSDHDDHRLSSLRFARVQHDDYLPGVLSKQQHLETIQFDSKDSIFHQPKSSSSSSSSRRRNQFIHFENIGHLGGVFLLGNKPAWFLTERSHLRIQPMSQDGQAIRAFAPYHNNRSCAFGFVYYLARNNSFRVCQFNDDPLVKYNSYWPIRKIPIRCTPYAAAYHQDTRCCIVATSVSTRATLHEDYDALPPGGRYPPPQQLKHTIKLYSGTTANRCAPLCLSREDVDSDDDDDDDQDSYQARERQRARDKKYNKREGDPKELINLLAVGTGYQETEDESCRGRIIVFDLEPQELQSGANSDETLYRLNPLCIKELKGPVSSVVALEGYLIVSVGPKLYVYFFDWKNKQLAPASFYDAQFFVTSMNTIKNYIVYGDMFKGLHFMRWREKGHRLTLLAKDYRHLSAGGSLTETYSTEYLVDDQVLGLLCADADKNLQLFGYAPKSAESIGGKRLLPMADFHIASHVNSMIRMKMRMLDEHQNAVVNVTSTRGRQDKLTLTTDANKQFLLFATLDGGIGYICLIDEPTHRRMSMLQTKMYTQLQHAAGLHPKSYRLYRSKNDHHVHKKNVIDGQLLWRFAHFSVRTQMDLAKQIGTTSEQLLQNMQELNQLTFFF
ncbi:cleavage and polyadenylation specificity factor subunit 1 [Acrasis kona]|uniref:Cleavage and polyadenylation specificity factor subunit 1 n=1 Tax=Acrasis kona TaxID=1008807 RepID=A0AAW2YH70_9EUKA